MATWRRCDSCRKVLPVDEFEGEAGTCSACGRKVSRGTSGTGAAAVIRTPASRRAESRRVAPTGVVGRGDPEMRSRRARATAIAQLVETHAEDYERLLAQARVDEGLV